MNKMKIYNERLFLVKSKMLRSPKYIFKHQISNKMVDIEKKSIKITGIGSLLGTKGHKHVLGIVLQIGIESYCMEDENARVTLSLKSNIKSFGYINDGFVVIATGFYKEGILEVSNFELPEIETISESRKIYTDNDIWHYEVH